MSCKPVLNEYFVLPTKTSTDVKNACAYVLVTRPFSNVSLMSIEIEEEG